MSLSIQSVEDVIAALPGIAADIQGVISHLPDIVARIDQLEAQIKTVKDLQSAMSAAPAIASDVAGVAADVGLGKEVAAIKAWIANDAGVIIP